MASLTTLRRLLSRRPVRYSLISLLVIVLLGLLLFYTPRFLVRYLLTDQLDALHIDHSGVETLSINPFTGELWFGPVTIGGKDTEAARLQSLGLTLGYSALWHHRISIERLILQGIDLNLVRDERRGFILNGIALDELLPAPQAKTQPAQTSEAWKPGLDILELRDSRLLFKDLGRGELAVDVERLQLTNFLAWQPENPGYFELSGRLNGIQLNWSGEATPFANNITLAIDSHTEGADLPKVVRFIGPLGLDRREGVYNARLKHEVALLHDGRIEGRSWGVIEGQAIDYQRQDQFALALDRLKADLDVNYAMQVSGEFSTQGKLTLDLGASQVGIENRTRVALNSGRVKLQDLQAAFAPDGSLRVVVSPDLDLEQVVFSGPVEISVDRLLDVLAILQSLSAGTEVTAKDTGLGDFAGGQVAVPSSDIKIKRVQSQGEKLTLASTGGMLDLTLKTNTQLSDIQVGVKERQINVEQIQSELQSLKLASGHGQLKVELVGNDAVKGVKAHGPIGEFEIASLTDKLEQFDLQIQSGAIAVQLAGENQGAGLSGLVYAKEKLPEVGLKLGGFSSKVGHAAFDLQGKQVKWSAAADAKADALAIEFAKGKETEMKFAQAQVLGMQMDERLQLMADTFSVDGLDLTLKRSLLESLFKGKAGEEPAKAPEKSAAATQLEKAQELLIKLGYDPGGVDGRMGPRTAAAIEAFQKQEGVSVDGRMSAGLLAQLELRATGEVADSGGPGLRIGRFALEGEPVIRFHDDLIDPPVRINTVFKQCEVRNLSTQAREKPSDIRVTAVINEFTNLDLKGWIRGLNQTGDLDLELSLKNLELSTYSPYVTQLAGVNLNSGQLDTQVTGKAKAGVLQGRVKLDLDDMEFTPLSKAQAARVTETMGVPLELAVSLLEDGNGRIALNLPVSGTLSKPDVDISSAVNKAIGGALKRVFPPTLALSLLSKIGKAGTPSFNPVVFAPGSAALDATGKNYVNEIADFLDKHPKLSLKVCGRSTARDLAQLTAAASAGKETKAAPAPAQKPTGDQAEQGGKAVTPAVSEETLKELAVARKNAVRAYLIDDRGIKADRVPECRSLYAADDQGEPRVVITF